MRVAQEVAGMHVEVWIEGGIVPAATVRGRCPLTHATAAGPQQKRKTERKVASRKRRRQQEARKCKRQCDSEKDPPQGGERAKRVKVQSCDSDQREKGERGKRKQGE